MGPNVKLSDLYSTSLLNTNNTSATFIDIAYYPIEICD